MLICKIKYSECSLTFFWDKRVFKEIITYNSWTLLGTFSNIFRNQVINILLNQFFNPVVVASRSIASQVSAAVSSFYLNFNVALRPSITKTYASSQHEKMISLIFDGTKGTFFLMYIFILPLMVEMPFVLSLWLKNVPEYAIQFSRLTLIDVFVWSINYPIDAAAMATKKIGLHIFVFSVALLMNFPATWIAFSLNAPAYSTMVIIIITSITAFSLRFFVIKKIIDFPMAVFLKTVLLPLGIVTALSSILPVIVLVALHEGFLRLCLSIITSIISITISMYFIGINTTDRKLLGEFVRRRFFQKKQGSC
jgi:O-antigen/teichoic acid export membrane protein